MRFNCTAGTRRGTYVDTGRGGGGAAASGRPHELRKRAAAAARRSITVRPGVARVVPSLRQFFSREMGASSREISAAGRGGRSKRGSGGECGLEGERREGGLLRCVLCHAVPGDPSPQCPLQPTSAARPHSRLNAALWERGGRAVPPVPRPRAPARWAQDAGPGVKHGTARHGRALLPLCSALLCCLAAGTSRAARPVPVLRLLAPSWGRGLLCGADPNKTRTKSGVLQQGDGAFLASDR